MKPEARRALAERIFEKAHDNGQTIDDDPLFASWIEDWIKGDIEITTLRENYMDLLQTRKQTRRDR